MLTPDQKFELETKLTRYCDQEGYIMALVVEAGSHAWGYATKHSDIDLKVIYVPQPWMRSVNDRHNTFRIPIHLKGVIVDVQGFELQKTVGMLMRSDATMNEIIRGGTTYARYPIPRMATELLVVADHYLNRPVVIDALYAQVTRNLFPKRGHVITGKGLIHALRYALMVEHLRNTGEFEPRLGQRTDETHPSSFGSMQEIAGYIRFLRQGGLEVETLLSHKKSHDLFALAEQLTSPIEVREPREHNPGFADEFYRPVCRELFKGNNLYLRWLFDKTTNILR